MRTEVTLLVALVVVIGAVPLGVAATATDAQGPLAAGSASVTTDAVAEQVQDGGTETPQENNTTENDSDAVSPGAQLAGVVAVQRTEVESEVSNRAFGQRVAAAATNDSKAAVIANDVEESRERIEALREQRAELEQARESGEISEGRYRAGTAQLTAEINAVHARLEQANESASTIPEGIRDANGINSSNIKRLQSEAKNLSGSEVGNTARDIAGENPGRGLDAAEEHAKNGPGKSDDAPGREADNEAGADDAETALLGNGTRVNTPDRENATNNRPVERGPPADAPGLATDANDSV